MKESEIFSLIVRTIGLLICIYAISRIAIAIARLFGGTIAAAFAMSFANLPALLVGLWLLRGAKRLILFAYPENDKIDSSDTEHSA